MDVRTYGDVSEMLDAVILDFIVVVTPTVDHVSVVIRALEKPYSKDLGITGRGCSPGRPMGSLFMRLQVWCTLMAGCGGESAEDT